MNHSLADRIDALLPQTQCTRCGYPNCRAYADALADAKAPLNRCPPGGQATIVRLAELLDAEPLPLDRCCGEEQPRRVAYVDEAWCIGCTLCIAACPVDAIVGAAKRMHAVIETQCTGCELCIAPCPVECIHMEPARSGPSEPLAWLREQAALAKARFVARNQRLDAAGHTARCVESMPEQSRDSVTQRKELIRQAVARSKARREAKTG